MNFECHITVKVAREHADILQRWVESIPGWSFSSIAGDPLLGKETFCYATAHFTDPMEAMTQTTAASEALSQETWLKVVRRKVEIVMFDERKVDGDWVKV